jgi:hypothetical protein
MSDRYGGIHMSRRLFSAFVIGAALGAAATSAFAITCYEIIDRSDVVIFRDTNSPVDLSNAGAPARVAMRSRGELLVFYDVETCRVVRRASPTGSGTLTTDEIVAGWRSFGTSGFGGTYGGTVATGSGGGIFAPTPTDVGRTPAAQDAAAARRGGY